MAPVRRVLIISFSFSPRPDAGARRPVGLCRHLPRHGWEPTVLTATNDRDPQLEAFVVRSGYANAIGPLKSRWGLSQDKSFDEQMRPLLPEWMFRISRVARNSLAEFLAYPDYERGWLEPAVRVGTDLLKRESFHAVLTTSPPVTAHLIGQRLARLSGLPWVADLRDLWSQGYAYPWSALRRLVERRLEQRVLRSASALVSVSQPLADALASIHPGKRTVAIVSGFDPDELAKEPTQLTSRFTLTYTGTIYPRKQNPAPLLEALRTALAKGRIPASDVCLRFYGRPPTEALLRQLCRGRGLEDVVEFHGLCSREEVVERQRESQLLLLLDWLDPGQPGVYTAKLFEYLAARRPILAFGPGGTVVESVLKATGAGSYETCQAGLEERLLAYYGEFAHAGAVQPPCDAAVLEPYSQRRMAHEFGRLLDSVTLSAEVIREPPAETG